MYECYNNIIGFTQEDCDCIATDRPEDYNVSTSGLYLDGLAPISGLIGLARCEKSMWDILEQARADAIKEFVVNSNTLLANRFILKRSIVNRQVLGEVKEKEVYNNTKNYAVVRVVCAPIRGGVWTIKGLGGVFTGTETIPVTIYNNLGAVVSGPHNITATNGVHSHIPLDIELPLYSKYLQPLEYYFVYAFDALSLPKDTELNCGCGNWVPNFNMNSPYYNDINARKSAPWANYVMLGGVEINSLTELEDMPSTMTNNMFGLTIEGNFNCKVGEVLCEDALDFKGNPLALGMALAIRYLTGVKVAKRIIDSGLLTRENMLDREEWESNVEDWQEEYDQHVNYIVEQADHTANDCFTCKDIIEMTREGLFS